MSDVQPIGEFAGGERPESDAWGALIQAARAVHEEGYDAHEALRQALQIRMDGSWYYP